MGIEKSGKSKWQRTRKLANDIHLWLGLASGLIVIAVCFSGTVYVFNTEISEHAAPHLYCVEAKEGEARLPIDTLLVRAKQNATGKISGITVPAGSDRTFQFIFRKEEETSQRGGSTVYMVNPYTGEVVGTSNEKNGTKEFMRAMFSLHRWLLLDRIEKPLIKGVPNRELGSMITGWATIIFTIGCITGLIIWFPQKAKYWKQGLKIKWNAGWKRVNHDLHNTLAFYSLIFLLLMGLTGPQWSFEWYRTGLQKTLGTYKPGEKGKGEGRGEQERRGEVRMERRREGPPVKQSERVLQNSRQSVDSLTSATVQISADEYLRIADSILPFKGTTMINFAVGPDAKTIISKTKTGFFAPAAGDRITIDPVTGKVLKTDIFRKKPLNERIAGSIKAIHIGNVYGTFTKLLYFLACLIATTLPVTGLMIWLNKKRRQ